MPRDAWEPTTPNDGTLAPQPSSITEGDSEDEGTEKDAPIPGGTQPDGWE